MSRSPALILLAGSVAFVAATDACALQASAPPAQAPLQGYDSIDAYATAMRPLKTALASPNESVQHSAMAALRQLRDPALAPLLERLRSAERWTLRVDSVLGLGEISAERRVSLSFIEQLPGERDREAAIGAAVGLGLADAAQLRTMLEWVDLPPAQKALIATKLREKGAIADPAALKRLAESKSPQVAALATAILIDQKAPDAGALSARVRDQISALPPNLRSSAVAEIGEACVQGGLKGAADFVAMLAALPSLNDDGRVRVLGALLILAPEKAYPILARNIAAETSAGRLLPYAALLLASGARAPAAEWDRFKGQSELLDAIGGVGRSITEGSDAGAYARLVALENRVLLRAALDGAKRLGESHERALGRECLAFVLKPGPTPPALSETLLVALCRLAELSPEDLRAPLADAELDQPTRDAFLIALLNAGTREAAAVAATAKGKASRLGEGNIAVLTARHASALAPDDLETLMRVAGGASNAPAPVRIQAAWLWTRHAGKADAAIEELSAAVRNGSSEESAR